MLSLSVVVAAEWSEPESRPIDRYDHIWESSPFVVATDVTPASESLADRFAVTGAARIGEQDVVFVLDRKSMERFPVSADAAANGVELVSVAQSDNIKELRATIRSGGEMTEIRYASDMASVTIAKHPSPKKSKPQAKRSRPSTEVATNTAAAENASRRDGPPTPTRVVPRRRAVRRR